MKSVYLMIFGLVVMFAGVGCIAFSLDAGWNTLTTVGTVLTAVVLIGVDLSYKLLGELISTTMIRG